MVEDRSLPARLARSWRSGRFVCIGLDPDESRIPEALHGTGIQRVDGFCREIVAATAPFASAFKLNSAFFERMGAEGARLLEDLIGHIRAQHPDRLIILDAKRGDIGSTNRSYAEAIFDVLGADVATVHPYMGRASLAPFLERSDRGVIVMAANSAVGAGEFQDLLVGQPPVPLYEHIGRVVAQEWNGLGNCAVTAGATEPEKLARLRRAVGEMPILLLGLGAQGGDLAACLRAGRAPESFGLIPNSSRAILYASSGPDFAQAAHEAARRFNDQLSGS
ncbi:orotidine-5'-phosphate decarboxylase [Brachybacterium hainanense]|uniref:Orotidine-5'-phosphate decarboxylase n=1 Tax=Brachybacterium hainanense TaxID=1541174 RepID=A0ABV6RAJ1_9MICO